MLRFAEGFLRRSSKDFTQLLFVPKSSAAKDQSQLFAVVDQNHIKPETFNQICSQAEIVSKPDSGFIKYLNKANKPKSGIVLHSVSVALDTLSQTETTGRHPQKLITNRNKYVYSFKSNSGTKFAETATVACRNQEKNPAN